MMNNFYIYGRPGALEYLKQIRAHPRVVFAFYSSQHKLNMKDTLDALNVEPPYETFDRSFCTFIDDHPRLKYL